MNGMANIAVRQPTLREMMELVVPTCSVRQHLEQISKLTGVSPRVLREVRAHEPVSAEVASKIRSIYEQYCAFAELKALEWELLNAALECNIKNLASASSPQSPSGDLPKAKTGIPRP